MPRHAGGPARVGRRVCLVALAGVVVACSTALPPGSVSESAGPDGRHRAAESSVPDSPAAAGRPAVRGDGTARTSAAGDPSPCGPHLSTAVRCGPAPFSADGIEAQTCVVAQGEGIWARTYCRNITAEGRTAALSLVRPDGRAALTHRAVDAGDEPALCETTRERGPGGLARYTAVAEFTDRPEEGRLLPRHGCN